MKNDFLNQMEEKVKAAQERGKELNEAKDQFIKVNNFKKELLNTIKEQFLDDIPTVLQTDGTFRIQTAWFTVMSDKEGYHLDPKEDISFCDYIHFIGFVADLARDLSETVNRKVFFEREMKEGKVKIRFYFWY